MSIVNINLHYTRYVFVYNFVTWTLSQESEDTKLESVQRKMRENLIIDDFVHPVKCFIISTKESCYINRISKYILLLVNEICSC